MNIKYDPIFGAQYTEIFLPENKNYQSGNNRHNKYNKYNNPLLIFFNYISSRFKNNVNRTSKIPPSGLEKQINNTEIRRGKNAKEKQIDFYLTLKVKSNRYKKRHHI